MLLIQKGGYSIAEFTPGPLDILIGILDVENVVNKNLYYGLKLFMEG